MKTNIFIAIVLSLFLSSCKSASNKDAQTNEKQTLEGEWVLNYIKAPQELKELYTRGTPLVKFDTKQNIISGKNGCNSFSGNFTVSGSTVSFKGPMTATRMYCGGDGEHIFMENLSKTESFSISKDGKILQFSEGGSLLMRFDKK